MSVIGQNNPNIGHFLRLGFKVTIVGLKAPRTIVFLAAIAGPFGTVPAVLGNRMAKLLVSTSLRLTTIGCGQERFGSGPLMIDLECLPTLHCLLHKTRARYPTTHRGYWSEVHLESFLTEQTYRSR